MEDLISNNPPIATHILNVEQVAILLRHEVEFGPFKKVINVSCFILKVANFFYIYYTQENIKSMYISNDYENLIYEYTLIWVLIT